MQYLEQTDIAKFFRAAYESRKPTAQRQHMAMLLMYFTGTRVSQMLDVRGEDVFQKDGRWVILLRAAKRGNITVRNLHISDDPAFDMTPIIALAAAKGRSKLFGGLSRQFFNDTLDDLAEVAGINSTFAHSHIFRHSIAMTIFDATQRIGAVTEFLAHKSPSSAFVYLRENDSVRAQEAVDSLVLA